MAPVDTFNTVENPAEGIYKEKGSAFLSFIYPLLEESLVKMILQDLKKAHPKARHICYAYHFGKDPLHFRSQDDGEPSGTAGRPIMNQIKKYQLENVLVAVVRYFGGTLLGASGLGNAYKLATVDAIEQSKVIIMHRYAYFKMEYSYSMEKYLAPWIEVLHGHISDKSYTELVTAEVAFPISFKSSVLSAIKENKITMQWPEEPTCEYLREDPY